MVTALSKAIPEISGSSLTTISGLGAMCFMKFGIGGYNTGGIAGRQSGYLAGCVNSGFINGCKDTGGIVGQAARELSSALAALQEAPAQLNTAINGLRRAMDTMHEMVFPGGFPFLPSLSSLQEARENLRRALDALDGLQRVSDSSAEIGRLLSRALDTVGDAVETLTGKGPAEFSVLGEPYRQASDSLFDALGGLSSEMSGLNSDVQSGNDALIADLRAISSQFNAIFNLLLDAVNDLLDLPEEGLDAVIQGTSEEDIAATREGKVTNCRNTGAVEGCYGVWPEFDPSGTRSDLTLEAVYAPWITLAYSVEQFGKLSLALAEGQFTSEAVLHVTESTQIPPKQDAVDSVTWDISLSGSGLGSGDTVPLRLLSPGGDGADVWQYQNGQWVEVDAVASGQYLLLSMQGTQGTFFLQRRGSVAWILILPAAGGAAGLAAALLIGARAKKKGVGKKSTQLSHSRMKSLQTGHPACMSKAVPGPGRDKF